MICNYGFFIIVGLVSLRQNAEDDYSTLLHLERVLIMRDGGDFVPTLDTPIVVDTKTSSAASKSLPGFSPSGSSGDHIGLSGGGSHLQKVERNIIEIKFEIYIVFLENVNCKT